MDIFPSCASACSGRPVLGYIPAEVGDGWVMSSSGMVSIGMRVMEPFFPYPAGPLVYGGRSVYIYPGYPLLPGISSLATDLPEGVSVVGHVCQDYEDMVTLLKSQVFSHGKRYSWSEQPLDGRVVGQVNERRCPPYCPASSNPFLKTWLPLPLSPLRRRRWRTFLPFVTG